MKQIKHTERNKEEENALITRLNKIEGQVKGIKKMIENKAYCTDIMIQVSSIQGALNALNKEILSRHIKNCVINDIRNGKDEVVDDLLKTLQRMMK